MTDKARRYFRIMYLGAVTAFTPITAAAPAAASCGANAPIDYRDVTRIAFSRTGVIQSFIEANGTTVAGGCMLLAEVTQSRVRVGATPCLHASADSPFALSKSTMNIGPREPAAELFTQLLSVVATNRALELPQSSPDAVPTNAVGYVISIDRCDVTTSYHFAVNPSGGTRLTPADSAVAELYMQLQTVFLDHVHVGTVP
jgi:hypothetical protein